MNVLVCCYIYLSHLLVEFDANLAGRICASESIVFKRSASTVIAGVVDDRLRLFCCDASVTSLT